MCGFGLHDLPIDFLGGSQAACSMMLDRNGERFGHGGHGETMPSPRASRNLIWSPPRIYSSTLLPWTATRR